MKGPARERTPSTTAANSKSSRRNSRQGIQLLSPTLQQSIASRTTDNPLASSRIAGNRTPASSRTDRVASFDFDSFTLESVRATSICSNSAPKCDKTTSSNNSIAGDNSADTDAERARNSSFPHAQQYVMPRTKSTYGGSAFNTNTSNVRMSGWLQKRKGVVIKRWKAYFCLLKRDDHLCLYASEDTVNGRLERRTQVLRVLLTDASDVFHVIGVDADGAPRKDEFRAMHSVDWRDWFFGFRDLLDTVSLQGALARKPELALLPSPSSSCLQQPITSSYRSRGSMDDAGDPVGYRLRGSIDDAGDSGDSYSSNQQQRVFSYATTSHDRRSTLHVKHQMREFLDKFPESDHFGTRSTMSAFSIASTTSTTSTNQSGSDDDPVGSSSNHHDILLQRHEPKGDNNNASPSDCPALETSRGSGSTARSSDVGVVKGSVFSW